MFQLSCENYIRKNGCNCSGQPEALAAEGVFFWTTQNIVDPIRKLEKSVAGFVSQEHGEKLVMEAPDIHTDNEVGSLASAVMKMADDINDYISEAVEAERVASEMKELATRDALTGIRNKAAFASYVQELQDELTY